MSNVVSNTCRITVISTDLRADLAVPAQIPVAELLSTLVASLGRDAADDGAAQGGWVLQRAAEPPLDPSASLAASQIRDGDVLHLRTRSQQLPEIAFDDVLDTVATGVLTRTARWEDRHTALATTLFASLALGAALLTALVTGPGWAPTAIATGAIAVLLLVAAGAMRPVRRGTALVAASFGLAYAAVSGATAVGGGHVLSAFGAAQFLLGACALVFAATVALLTLGIGVPGFVAVITAGVLTAIGTAVADSTTLSSGGTAALVAAVALAVSPVLPTLAFRIARLPLPSIPADAADLRRDSAIIDSRAVLRQAILADHYLTGMLGGVAIAIGGAGALLALGSVSERILGLVLAALCLLRARLFSGRAQRFMLLAGGAAAGLAALVYRAGTLDGDARIYGAAIPAVVVAIVLLGLAVVLPGRRWAPPWGRTADIVETLLVLSVIPLALSVMGVYGTLRHLKH